MARQIGMSTLPFVAAATVFGLALAACGQSADSAPKPGTESSTPAAAPTDLTCPSDERVGTDGGLLAEQPDGLDTRDEAIEAWLSRMQGWGEDYVLTDNRRGAWILREDGTAHAKVDFIRHQGFTVHGYTACSPS